MREPLSTGEIFAGAILGVVSGVASTITAIAAYWAIACSSSRHVPMATLAIVFEHAPAVILVSTVGGLVAGMLTSVLAPSSWRIPRFGIVVAVLALLPIVAAVGGAAVSAVSDHDDWCDRPGVL